MKKQEQLDDLAKRIVASGICPELSSQARLVMGNGNPDADIFLLGEAPGEEEDLAGVPFIGRSGKALNAMLASVGMGRDEVYTSNVVKYRPPENRDPTKAEKVAFLPFTEEEITIVDPDVFITLGRHAMEHFLPKEKISKIHGQPQIVVVNNRERVLIPLYHPAAAMFDPRLKKTLLADFATVPAILKERLKHQ